MIARAWRLCSSRTVRNGLLLLAGLAVAGTWWCDRQVRLTSAPYLYGQLDALPHNRVGLVLGTAQRNRGGGPNPYFTHRIEAAVALYHAGKVDHLLLSGDNRHLSYNEPWAMRKALMERGVDSTRITLDFAGFRTLDSMVRAREVFGQQQFTVISQRFHNERAVYIARERGIEAIGFNATDVGTAAGLRTQLREKLARVKVYIDALFGIEPHFLGDPVTVGEQRFPSDQPPLMPEAQAR